VENSTIKDKLFKELKNILDKKAHSIRYKDTINKYFFDFIQFLNKKKELKIKIENIRIVIMILLLILMN
jgi:hypothetical protein